MAGETIITVVGNLTRDPELRHTSQGTSVVGFTVASTARVYDQQAGRTTDGSTLYVNCSAWRDLGDHVAQTLSKGMRVIVQGRLQQRTYQAQDGSNRTAWELQVDAIGPDLRFATAQVTKTTQANGFQDRGRRKAPPPSRATSRRPTTHGATTSKEQT